MDINRSNYEEFFLLYADRELDVAQRSAVENFVAENPDLFDAFQQIQDTVLTPDKFEFDSHALLKDAGYVSATEEKLLLLLDGELDETETKKIYAELEQDEILKLNFTQLQKARLTQSDLAVFQNKHLLYRYDRKPVAYFKNWQWAAAAVLLGFGIYLTIGYLQPRSSKVDIASNSNETIGTDAGSSKKSVTTVNGNETLQNRSETSFQADDKQYEDDKQAAPGKSRITDGKKESIKKSLKVYDNQPITDDIAQGALNNQLPGLTEKNNDRTEKELLAKLPEGDLPENRIIQRPALSNAEIIDQDLTPLTNPFAKSASLSQTEGEDVDNEEGREPKNAFLRKAKRIIERKLKIKPGHSVKIAAFEFTSN